MNRILFVDDDADELGKLANDASVAGMLRECRIAGASGQCAGRRASGGVTR